MIKLLNPMRRYHYKVYFPANTSEMCLEFLNRLRFVNLTYHAAYQMCDDPRSIIDLPAKSDLMHSSNKLIEFYENLDFKNQPNGIMQKMLLRVPHLNEKFDFTYLIAREGYIISAWCSEKTDDHRLTKSLYEYYCPPDIKESIYQKIRDAEQNYAVRSAA